MAHVQIDVPPALRESQRRLLCVLSGSLCRVACGVQAGTATVLHLYGRHCDVSGARVAVHRAINTLLGNECVEAVGCLPTTELLGSGCYALYGTRIDCRSVLVVDGRVRLHAKDGTGGAQPSENGKVFLCRVLHAADRTSRPLLRETLHVHALRLRYVLYYRRQAVEDILSLHECFLETGAKAEVVSFDVHRLRRCMEVLESLCCDVAEVEAADTADGVEVLVVQTASSRTSYCWSGDAERWLGGRDADVCLRLCLSQETRAALGSRANERLRRVAATAGCQVALGDVLCVQGVGRCVAHALQLLMQERPCQNCFFVDERSQRRLTGRRGRNIKKAMRRHGVHVRFMPEAERRSLCVDGNVIVRAAGRNSGSLVRARETLGGRAEDLQPRLVSLSDFVVGGADRYLYLHDKVVVLVATAEEREKGTGHGEALAQAKTGTEHERGATSFLSWIGGACNVMTSHPAPAPVLFGAQQQDMKSKHALRKMLCRTKNVLLAAMLAVFCATHMPIMIALGALSEYVFCRTVYRGKIVHVLRIVWIETTLAALGCYCRRRIILAHSSDLASLQRSLVISNHLTNYDWVFSLRVLYHLGKYSDLCIVLKESLRKVPVFGRGMEIFGFIFVKRCLADDRGPIQSGLAVLSAKPSFSLLIFPEGTIIDKATHQRSLQFARRRRALLGGEPVDFEEVLVPRTSGYKIISEVLFDRIQGVVDTTLLFNPYRRYPQSTISCKDILLGGDADISFIFVMDFIEKSDAIRDEAFLYTRFRRKDALIRKYSRDPALAGPVSCAHFKAFCARENVAGDKYTFTEIPVWTKSSPLLLSGTLFFWAAAILCLLRRLMREQAPAD
ncbi:UNVERIFIED_CONTAM: hypothetical protein PYX00_011271 [Menopon gallinae]|uniref:Phospholipid/glycerol acyltransferase domain-containing protein n=1 Tax=Menopon gallinae TaxID=328185 RepID=A0AAW2H6Z8_9NEOP